MCDKRFAIVDIESTVGSMDFSDLEARIVAAEMQVAYGGKPVDVHRETAAHLFSVPYESVTEQQRRYGKLWNHAAYWNQDLTRMQAELENHYAYAGTQSR